MSIQSDEETLQFMFRLEKFAKKEIDRLKKKIVVEKRRQDIGQLRESFWQGQLKDFPSFDPEEWLRPIQKISGSKGSAATSTEP